jgi:hypothetical protein
MSEPVRITLTTPIEVKTKAGDVVETIAELASRPSKGEAWRLALNAGGPRQQVGDVIVALACWHFRLSQQQFDQLDGEDALRVIQAAQDFCRLAS